MTATGQEIPNGSIVLKDGRIVAVGAKLDAPPERGGGRDGQVRDAWADRRSLAPRRVRRAGTDAESDARATTPVTAEVWAEHSFWPQDPQIPLAIAGGITTIQALPARRT